MRYKILFLLHFPPPVHGSSLVGQFINESVIINQAFDCRYINVGTSASVNEIGRGGLTKLGRYFLIFWKVLKQLIFFRPNLCYFSISTKGNAFYKDALMVLFVKLFSVKLVYHLHNKGVSLRQDKWFDDILYRKVFKNADVILLSKYLFPDIHKYIKEERVHYCPNGVPEVSSCSDIKVRSEESKPVRILFFSNLIESKGVFVLLEACKLLKDKQLVFQCTFVGGQGDISGEQFYQKAKELGLNDFVHYAGPKYGLDKEAAFAQADIFAFPTYYQNECFPLVILEAMQNCLPVVSTFEGGIRDIVEEGKTGFLVPQNNVIPLAKMLEELINDPIQRKQMGLAGREKYDREFTVTTFENRLKEILEKISGSSV